MSSSVGARSSSIVLTILAVAGCGAGQRAELGQREVLQQYIKAVQANSSTTAYGLLHEDVRRRVSQAEFSARWKTVRKELDAQIQQLNERMSKPIEARATVVYDPGIEAKLSTSADNFWKIDEGISVTFQTMTPIDAVRAFLKAVKAGQFRVVMSLMAEDTRKDVQTWLTEMEKALSSEIPVTGNRAEVRFGKDYFIKLIRVNDQWKVLDFK